MSLSKYTTVDSMFFVEIVKPTPEQVKSFYAKNTGEIKSSDSANAPKEFKKAIIKHTCNEEKYPIDSVWMMGESPGIKINFFGDLITAIQEKDLYARID